MFFISTLILAIKLALLCSLIFLVKLIFSYTICTKFKYKTLSPYVIGQVRAGIRINQILF